MQIKSLRLKSYRSWKIDETIISEADKQKRDKILLYEKLRKNGCSEAVALEAITTSRATFFRWQRSYRQYGIKGLLEKSSKPVNIRQSLWDRTLYLKILMLRQKNPCWGKIKIHTILNRDFNLSVPIARVGRIISDLIAKNKVKSVAFVTGKKVTIKKRKFNKHAKKWKYGMKSKQLGEMIQLDHMTVYSNSACIKHFKAVCPMTKIMVSNVYSNAKSTTAAKFLEKVIDDFPFKISSIQVDGGSEFMKDFEQLCQENSIDLFVLPPKSPKYKDYVAYCTSIEQPASTFA
jgi:transposase